MIKHLILTWAVVAAGVSSAMFAQQRDTEATVKQKFSSGGSVRLHLEAGGYTIMPTDADEIVVTCHARTGPQLRQLKVQIKPAGSRADVYVLDTPHNSFTATIEVPRRSHLWARLTAGEIVVGVVEGDKDLEINAGRLEVDIPKPEEYGLREASVTTGSIQSSAFAVSKGGLFRSFHQQGPGRYRLHAYVMAGEIDLRSGS